MQNAKIKMENDKVKFKNEFKKRLYNFVLKLLKFISALSKNMVSDTLSKQLIRSGTSVLANYIEAQSASSKKDFINFFTHSLKSANESKFWLSLLKDTKKGNLTKIDTLLKELIQIANILASSIKTLRTNK